MTAGLSLQILPVTAGRAVRRWSGLVLTGADEAGLVGEDDDLYPVAEAEFGEDPSDVCLHGAFHHGQPIGDLGVGAATRHLDQDLALSVGELVHPFVDR